MLDGVQYEKIDIYNVTNGERFSTYLMSAEAGSKTVSINGAAAHKASPNDIIIICAYGLYEESEAKIMGKLKLSKRAEVVQTMEPSVVRSSGLDSPALSTYNASPSGKTASPQPSSPLHDVTE